MDPAFTMLNDFPLPIVIHLVSLCLIVFFLYQRRSGSREFCFSYMAIGVVVFALCFLLERVKLELGFALGLFAIFGIIRYRTITIPIKEMTYLFVVIGLSVINALSGQSIPASALIIANVAIFVCLALLEAITVKNYQRSILVRYEKIENIQQGKRPELIADLVNRIGANVSDVRIESVDFMRDTVDLRVYFEEQPATHETPYDAPSPINLFGDK